ncbi:Ig-like domain-containing protein [Gelidibacter japonicus]|uniref:Ig-like domain-containing protein n=1 Tax=Gelidibacter japonicus TaxID=1962232 RepID=UPI0013D112E0|nr:Ig-like domain-containing protein [Gelidibacter japonicus]
MNKPTTNLFSIAVFFIILFSCQFLLAQQLAFPSAKGAGAYVTGGRGHEVYHVTNLNDGGVGSLRDALSKNNRTIVFDISGVIKLTSSLSVVNRSNITIAGQTAPEGGITIDGERVYFENVQNIIVRHIRFKGGIKSTAYAGGPTNSFQSKSGALNQIYDHCTFAFGFFQGGSWYETNGTAQINNLTVQRCLFAENDRGALSGSESGSNVRVGNYSFISNAFYNVSHRTPNAGGDGGRIDIINNVVWFIANRFTQLDGSVKLNHLGNYYNYNNTPASDHRMHMFETERGLPEIYTNGNKYVSANIGTPLTSSLAQINENNTLAFKYFVGSNYGKQLPANHFVNKQHILNGEPFKVLSGDEALIDVSNNVGCNARLNADGSVSSNLDVLDAQWLNNIKNGVYTKSRLPQSQWIIPHIPSVSRDGNFYKSNPHIPEIWFKANVPDGQDHNDIAPSGYTWLEEYLNQVDRPKNEVAVQGVQVTPSTAELAVAETIQLSASFTPSNASNKNGTWTSSDASIATVSSNGLVTAVSVGEATITFKSADGGFTDTALIKVFPEALQASAGIDQQICKGESATLTASGGTNYVWNTGETTKSIDVTPEATTTYTVTVSDDFGQSDEASVTVTVNDIPTANAGDDQTICNGETTTLTATGGTSYLWSTGQTTASIEVSPTTDTVYSVEVSTNGCSSTDDVSVFVKDAPVLSITGNLTIVEGKTTTLTVSGSDNYLWNTGGSSESITVSPEVTTTYSVSSNGPHGCSSNASVTVTVVKQVIANAGQDVDICAGSSTTLTATGGDTYLWSTGATSESIEVNPNATTTYSVTVYDSTKTSSDTDEVVVTVNPLPIVDAGSGSTIDSGESVTLTATGATSYIWSTGASTASITVSPNATRTYTVTGTSNGCEATDTVKVTVRNTVEVIADAGADQSICAGSSATLTATGGSTYLWNTGATTASITISPSSTTTYSVTAFDSSGKFSDTDEVKVTVNALPAVDAGSNITINSGESATLTATGATSYKWSTGATSASITVSPTTTRTYTVTGTRNGCEVTDTVRVTVLNPVQVIANAGADQSICAGSSVTLTATGGSTYLWSTGATTASITISPSTTTTYSVTAFDSTGKYSDTDEVKVTVNPVPTVSAGKNITITSGESTTLTASGATTYKWSTGATSASITVSPTATRTYTVTGTKNGCEATATVKVTVENPQVVVARAGGNKDICQGTPVTLTASGGDRYLWSTGEKTASITVNPKTTTKYSVTAYIGEASGTDEAVVTVSPKPNVTIINGSEAAILKGEFITLSAQGANRYKWSNGATQPNIAVRPTKTQTYDVVGYINDCSSEKSIKVNVFEKIVADAGEDVAICLNESTVLTARGPANSEYLWSTGETTKSITVNPDKDTEYSVMVYHALDSDTDNVMVSVRNCETSQIVDDNATIEDDTALEFLIHPNPTYGDVHIKISGLSNVSSIHLYDLSGKSLYNEEINTNDQQSYNKTLNLANFASGIYLLQLVDNLRVITKKIVLR